MRFKVTGDHRKILEKQKFIEFDDLFSLDEIEKVSAHVDQVLAKRTKHLIDTQSCSELFHAGRDVWRDDPILEKFICNRGLAQLTAQLFQQNTLCLGFDQVLRSTTCPGFPNGTPTTLQQKSCILPLAGVVLIRLSGEADPLSLLPKKRENVVLISPHLIVPWEMFFQEPKRSFLMIGYAPAKALYVREKNDPNLHSLKKLGYVFGDHLNTNFHPLLYK
ncbi:MAG TPA: hypothetical protein VHK67_01860 [Rhabdochlamydiaceae bacterium]|jgi:hypothetical protein|nr:hypothetical protein [Rhabdochlamydiaceae bacterium]